MSNLNLPGDIFVKFPKLIIDGTLEDNILIEKILSGDQSAFRNLVEENQKLVLNACYKFTSISEDAEDIMQEVFVEAYKSIHKFRGDCKISTWLYQIAVSRSIDFLRNKKRKKRSAILTSLFGIESDEEVSTTVREANPQKLSENKERISILMKYIDQLAENQQIAFTLSQIDGMRYKEIAEIMNTSVSSVESLIFRARKNLKKKLQNFYEKY